MPPSIFSRFLVFPSAMILVIFLVQALEKSNLFINSSSCGVALQI